MDLSTLAVQVGEQQTHYLDVVGTEHQDKIIVGQVLRSQYIVTLNAPGHTIDITM